MKTLSVSQFSESIQTIYSVENFILLHFLTSFIYCYSPFEISEFKAEKKVKAVAFKLLVNT